MALVSRRVAHSVTTVQKQITYRSTASITCMYRIQADRSFLPLAISGSCIRAPRALRAQWRARAHQTRTGRIASGKEVRAIAYVHEAAWEYYLTNKGLTGDEVSSRRSKCTSASYTFQRNTELSVALR